MDERVRRPIEDFASVLRALGLRQEASSALVGGQAVNAWATVYRESMGARLEEHLPFTSSDIDVAGSPDLLVALHRELGGVVRVAGPRQIAYGTVSIGDGAGAIELDVLRVVNGVKSIRPSDTIGLELCGAVVPVLFPHILLRGKLANATQLEQQGRQDVKHVKILSLVLEQFLRPLVLDVRPSDERAVLKLLREVLEILTSPDARRFAQTYGASFRNILPLAELESASPRLKAFASGEISRADIL
jgi:hypothetical protein